MTPADTPPPEILAVLRRAGLLAIDDRPGGEPLSGGVSSEIWRVDAPAGPVCLKRALPRLKVAADWRAPIERGGYEAAWLREAAVIVPGAVPRLVLADAATGALVMSFLEPATHRSWKTELAAGRVDAADAAAVGELVVRIHAATALRGEIAARFRSDAIFHEIRLAPYLLATAAAHPALERPLQRLARRTAATRLTLVHGDVSPKNILLGPSGPVLLDAECAWYGDPAFDLAFCLNHLLLKCLWVPEAADRLLDAYDALAERYLAGVVWEGRAALEARAAALLPGLLLARVDGKSPVEYVTDERHKAAVRSVARELLEAPTGQLAAVRRRWGGEVGA